jgi:hypothetical protein
LEQFRARFKRKAKAGTAWGTGRLDVSVRGLVETIELIPQVKEGWQRYFARRLDAAVHYMIQLEDVVALCEAAFSIGINIKSGCRLTCPTSCLLG